MTPCRFSVICHATFFFWSSVSEIKETYELGSIQVDETYTAFLVKLRHIDGNKDKIWPVGEDNNENVEVSGDILYKHNQIQSISCLFQSGETVILAPVIQPRSKSGKRQQTLMTLETGKSFKRKLLFHVSPICPFLTKCIRHSE